MKRGRCDEEEQSLEVKDWVRLFHIESILAVLHPYLSTRTLIRLSCVNKRMNTTWINNERRLGVLNMRNRIFVIRGRYYKRNPLTFVKKASLKACSPPAPGEGVFKCWECNGLRSIYNLFDQRIFKHTTCNECAKGLFRKTYVEFNSLFYELWKWNQHLPSPSLDGRKWLGEFIDRQILEAITPYLFTYRFECPVRKDYVLRYHVERIIYWLRKAYPAPPAKDGSIAMPLY